MGRKCLALISVRSRALVAFVCTSLVVPAVAFIVASVLVSAIFDDVFPVMAIGFVMVDHLAVVAEFVLLTVGVELPRPASASKSLAGAVAGIVAGAVVAGVYGKGTVKGGSVDIGTIEILLVFFTLTTLEAMHYFGASLVVGEPKAVANFRGMSQPK
jgi:hypothetical protein